ncbi:MAG: prepilin-type N-terminal cleavage/methylation domain-containing protein [Pseudomonadales bacterium]
MKRHNPFPRGRGFTVVELVVVIVLIAIFAAVALPRFIDVDDESRRAAARSTMSAFQEAVRLARAKWLADGTRADSLVIEGRIVQFNDNGWPKSQVSDTADCMDVWNDMFRGAEPIVPYVANATPPAWSALGLPALCIYIHQYGDAYTVADPQPLFLYQPLVNDVAWLDLNM